ETAIQHLRGVRRGAHKIGCTTAAMQSYLRIASPCSGAVFVSRVYRNEARLPFNEFLHVGIECEIAVRLEEDVTSGPFTAERMADVVSSYMTSMELVDDRFDDFRAVDTPTLIADDFFAWGVILGPEMRPSPHAIARAIGTT